MNYDGYARLKGWLASDFGMCPAGERQYYHAELARHGFSCRGKRVLEVGFGNGFFLGFARDSGAHVLGVEIQGQLVDAAIDRGFLAYHDLAEVLEAEQENSVDLVVAFDVMEHLSPDETVDMLQKMHRLTKQETGLLLARFPNGDSPFSLPLQNGDYTHKTAVGAGVVKQILGRSGWKINYLGEPTWTFATFKDRMLRGGLHVLRRFLERSIMSLYYGRGGPSTLFYNYILVASPLPAQAIAKTLGSLPTSLEPVT